MKLLWCNKYRIMYYYDKYKLISYNRIFQLKYFIIKEKFIRYQCDHLNVRMLLVYKLQFKFKIHNTLLH